MAMGPAATRWRSLVRARRKEIEQLSGAPDRDDTRYWERRAKRFAARLEGTAQGDPLTTRLRRVCRAGTTVLDVGSGPGRFALAIAPRVAEVVALDPSRAMLAILRREARKRGLANVRTVEGRWPEASAEVDPVDVAFSSYVLPIVEDAPRFLRALDAAARRHAFLYLGAFTADAVVDPIWRHFHGTPRRPGPTWLDAVAVLREIGMEPEVEVVEVRSRTRFATLAEAVRDYRDLLVLPDTPDVRRELAGLLREWLVTTEGALRPPIATLPAAVVRWQPSGLGADG
ncbi:MAG TPA: class I SAM-dependent methyltransferase [Acidimicrobiales bacterium]|nr:class I SAM-dependent methyltransferase [Acidimicrobiales bacterium]